MPRKKKAPWEQLLVSEDLPVDLDMIYSSDILEKLSLLMEKNDSPALLASGVHDTARSFLRGKYEKQVDKGGVLQHSGRHLVNIGIAAHQLSYALRQATKSKRIEALLVEKLSEGLTDNRPFGKAAHSVAQYENGPAVPLTYLQEISATLAELISDLVEIPDWNDNQRAIREAGETFVTGFSADQNAAFTGLPVNHALEEAAITFQRTWEKFSDAPYIRGRFKHERGGYDSLPAYGLFLIVSQLDPSIKESLCGTAIENIRRREKSE